jgi:hypothetical protein
MAAPKKPAACKTATQGKGAPKKNDLTPKQRLFVLEYMKDGNGTQAAIRAGYNKNTAREQASRLLAKSNIQAFFQQQRAKVDQKLEMTRDEYIARMAKLFTADPRGLVEYRRGCCRYCWGFGHAYQWTEAELQEARDKAINDGKPAPDESGGTGYNRHRKPNPECPECGGDGYGRVIIRDSSEIDADARVLLAGYKRTKDGEEVLMHSQQKAGETLGKIMGWLDERPTVQVDVAVSSREKLASAIARIESKG